MLDVIEQVIRNNLSNWQQLPYADVELSIALLLNLSEALPVTQGNHFISNLPTAQRLIEMIQLVKISFQK